VSRVPLEGAGRLGERHFWPGGFQRGRSNSSQCSPAIRACRVAHAQRGEMAIWAAAGFAAGAGEHAHACRPPPRCRCCCAGQRAKWRVLRHAGSKLPGRSRKPTPRFGP